MPKILDHNGQPIDTGRLAEPQTARVAQLWNEFGNHPARGLTPTRLRSILLEAERGDLAGQLDLADDMEECDPHLAGEINKRKIAIASLPWSIVPPPNASAAEKSQAAQVAEWFESFEDFEDVLLAMMDAVLKGFQCHELVWRFEGGVQLPRIIGRPQRWFTPDGTGDGLLLRNPQSLFTGAAPGTGGAFVNPALLPRPAQAGEPLWPFAWMVHRHRARNGYIARSALLRVLAWPYLYKAYAWRDFAEFLEIYGLPLRIGRYPSGASDEEKLALLQAVTQLGHNAAGIMPQGMAMEFFNAGQGAKDPFLGMLDYCDAAESKAILGQTLSAGEGQHGTQALGKVHNEVRHDIGNADARQVAGTLSQQLVGPIALLNIPGVDPRRLPRLELDTGDAEDLALFAEKLPGLAKAGLKIPVKWVHDKLRIPEPTGAEPVLQAPEPPPAMPGKPPVSPDGRGPVGSGQPAAAAALRALVERMAALTAQAPAQPQPAVDLIDQLVAEQAGQWQPLLGPLVEPLLADLDKAIAAGHTLEQWAEGLPGLVPKLDAQPLTRAVGQAAFSARLAGEADLDLEPNPE